MGLLKALGVVAGAAVAVVAAPLVIPAAAAIGGAALTVAGTAAGTASAVAAAAGTAVASTAVGGAVVGAATTAGASIAGIATAAGTAVASSAVGTAVASAGSAAMGMAATAGSAIASSSVGAAAITAVNSIALETVVSGAIGASLTYSGITVTEGISNNAKADELIASAETSYKEQEKQLKIAQDKCKEALEEYNLKKLKIYSDDISRGIKLISKIKQPKVSKIDVSEHNPELFMTEMEIHDTSKTVFEAKEVLSNLVSGSKLSIGATLGTLSLVSQFGVASTGAAISSLSGVAASNATIAALGGGAIAAGGGGMVLGSAVLGGLAVAPLSVVSSWKFAKKSEENLTHATKVYADILLEVEKGKSLVTFIDEAIYPRVNELSNVMDAFSDIYKSQILPELDEIIKRNVNANKKVDFQSCSASDKDKIQMAIYATKKLKSLIALKMFDDQGNILPDVDTTIQNIKETNYE